MFNIPALTWTLTAVLALGGSHNLLQAARSRHPTDRINNTLHALMHALMTAMLWNLAPATLLAQIALLTGAALWFTLQAVARPQFKLLCTGTQGRLKCAYHALTMAGAATMITLMTTHTPPNPTPNTPAAEMAMPHHTITATTAPTAAAGNTPAILLTILFAAAAATFLSLLLRRTTTTHHHTTPKHTTRTQHALEALSATTMALMAATMTT